MKRTEELAAKLKALQALKGYGSKEMGVKIHASQTTWNRRLNNPGSMTVAELIRLEKAFGVTLLNTEVKA